MMKTKDSGIGLLLVFCMAIMGLAAMPDDPPSAAPAEVTQAQRQRESKKTRSVPAEPSITCVGDDCWWTDIERPDR